MIDSVSKKVLYLYYPMSKQLEAFQMAKELRKEKEVKLIPYEGTEIKIQEGVQ